MRKGILFDLDGTLTDSGEGIINCAIVALRHFSVPIPSREELRVFVGPPLNQTFVRFGVPEERVQEAIDIYRSRYIPIGKYENTPYPGIRKLLEKLRSDGFLLYVATSKPEQTSVDILEHFDLANFFEQICGASMDLSRNSKEDVISYLLKTAQADSLIMVGDTKFDVIGAVAHGIPTVGVSWGYGTVSDLRLAGAAAIAHTPQELYSILITR